MLLSFPFDNAKVRRIFESAKHLTEFNLYPSVSYSLKERLNIFSQLGQNALIICIYEEKVISLHTQGDIFFLKKAFCLLPLQRQRRTFTLNSNISLILPLNVSWLIVTHITQLNVL